MEHDLNLIKPKESDNWIYPANVLAGFDLSICAVAMIAPGTVYALYPESLKNRVFRYCGNTYPVTTMKRAFKYMQRGFKPDTFFFLDMVDDESMLPVMSMLEQLYLAGDKDTVNNLLHRVSSAMPVDYENYGDYGDD